MNYLWFFKGKKLKYLYLISNVLHKIVEKKLNFEWYTQVDGRVWTKNHDWKYLKDQNLMKYFIGTKTKNFNIYRD
jgi:hypothetical protein